MPLQGNMTAEEEGERGAGGSEGDRREEGGEGKGEGGKDVGNARRD